MTISEFSEAFSQRKIQVHVDNAAEFNECLDMLIDLGFSLGFTDREYWCRKEGFAIVNSGGRGGLRVGLNYKDSSPVGNWGEIIHYHDLVFTSANEQLRPASHSELLALLGM